MTSKENISPSLSVCVICIVTSQVRLLKEGKEVPDDLHSQTQAIQDRLTQREKQQTSTPVGTPTKPDSDSSGGENEPSARVLREKVSRGLGVG